MQSTFCDIYVSYDGYFVIKTIIKTKLNLIYIAVESVNFLNLCNQNTVTDGKQLKQIKHNNKYCSNN